MKTKKDFVGYYPLLLTGTIDSSVYGNTGNRIPDIAERLSQYEDSIKRYILYTPFNPIIFIENSGFDFDSIKFQKIAEENRKQFEFIRGTVCVKEVMARGKSFGDAFVIHEALEKSELLKSHNFFYKITGRIFLKNSYDIVKTRDKYRNEFICYTGLGWCLTNIFKANKKDYLEYLDSVYLECDETKIRDIEISFYYRLNNADIQIGSFETYPYFDGIQGATLRAYSGGGIERTVRNIFAKMHVFILNSRASKIVAWGMKIRGVKPYI